MSGLWGDHPLIPHPQITTPKEFVLVMLARAMEVFSIVVVVVEVIAFTWLMFQTFGRWIS